MHKHTHTHTYTHTQQLLALQDQLLALQDSDGLYAWPVKAAPGTYSSALLQIIILDEYATPQVHMLCYTYI